MHKSLGLAMALFALTLAAAGAASQGPVQLGLTPVESDDSYFNLTLEPGQVQELAVLLANHGSEAIQVRTYPADAYTIVNGGFGARLDGEAISGATTWLTYTATSLTLDPGTGITRSFTVTVPPGTPPGAYITSIVLQNADPVQMSASADRSVAIDQITRHAVAVAITVPGIANPALEIGEAIHRTVAEKSAVAVELKNTGNSTLAPSGEFILLDAAGNQLTRWPIIMGSFYAGTSTFAEVPFDQRLNPGKYSAILSLSDESGAASSGQLEFEVPRLDADAAPQALGESSRAATVRQEAAQQQSIPWGFAAVAVAAAVALLIVVFIVWRLGPARAAKRQVRP